MQLDTVVRACYVADAPLVDDVVAAMLEGTEFCKMKDADGKPLTDTRLVELATPYHPRLPPVYKETSGLVHLSVNHLRAAWQVAGDQIGAGVPLRPDVIPGKLWLALLAAMTKATEQTLWLHRDLGEPEGPTARAGARMAGRGARAEQTCWCRSLGCRRHPGPRPPRTATPR